MKDEIKFFYEIKYPKQKKNEIIVELLQNYEVKLL